MIRVVRLLQSNESETEQAFEVAISNAIRKLRDFDELDRPKHRVKLVTVFKTTAGDWSGVFIVTD